MAGAPPRLVLEVRRRTVGYVSQFLRVIPRVSARDIVAEPLHALGVPLEEARGRGEALLARLNIPAAMWELAPATFSGGEQQRVNIARGFVRSEEHTSELQSLMRISYAVFCLQNKTSVKL